MSPTLRPTNSDRCSFGKGQDRYDVALVAARRRERNHLGGREVAMAFSGQVSARLIRPESNSYGIRLFSGRTMSRIDRSSRSVASLAHGPTVRVSTNCYTSLWQISSVGTWPNRRPIPNSQCWV